MFQHHVGLLQDEKVHEFGSVSRTKTGVVDILGFVIKLYADRIDLNALEERLFRLLSGGKNAGRVVFELKESSQEVEGVLINVETEWKNIGLSSVSNRGW